MNPLESMAAGIFARHGVDFARARRAGGWTNATWLAGGLAHPEGEGPLESWDPYQRLLPLADGQSSYLAALLGG